MPYDFILRKLLIAKRDDVTDMLLTEYDDEKEAEIHRREVSDAKEEGFAEGITEGKVQKRNENIALMISIGNFHPFGPMSSIQIISRSN